MKDGGLMNGEERPKIAREAMRVGRELVLDTFQTWRRSLDCVDALILLVITNANVDGVLFSRALRARYGALLPIAPDHLRQPVSSAAVAVSLGLPHSLVRRRVARLAAHGECLITPEGMLISEHQLEAANRTEIVQAVYARLAVAYAELQAIGFFDVAGLPRSAAPPSPPIRSASGFAAKYVQRTLDALCRHVGDVRDALIVLRVLEPPEAGPGPGARAVPVAEIAAVLGLSPDAVRRRVRGLVARGLCARRDGGVAARPGLGAEPWLAEVLARNVESLFQLYAALAEVGALAEFEAKPGG
jgi:DNA-binding Lrp family transcriptional regulator